MRWTNINHWTKVNAFNRLYTYLYLSLPRVRRLLKAAEEMPSKWAAKA